eukprot:jgi/Mesvir1/3207/Mv16356-RA.1
MEGQGSSACETATPASTFDWVLGCCVSIQTTLGESFEGEIFAFDEASNCVVLQGPASGPANARSLRLLQTSFVQSVQVISGPPPQGAGTAAARLPYVDRQQCRIREEAAVKLAEEAAQRVGIGVTEEAQRIFDALSKTLPVRWRKADIIVLDEVCITSPYLPDNCSGGSASLLQRVKKVLELERKRLQPK